MIKSIFKLLSFWVFTVMISLLACWPDAAKKDAEEKRVSDSLNAAKAKDDAEEDKANKDLIANAAKAKYDAYIKGEDYGTVKIGNQEWTKENLNVTTFRNGDPIPQAATDEDWKEAGRSHTPAWCYYKNNPDFGGVQYYGKLYNFWAVIDKRGLAPKGFHIPNNNEWIILLNCLGGMERANQSSTVVGEKLIAENGFNALLGGIRYDWGGFTDINQDGNYWQRGDWWTSTYEGCNNPPCENYFPEYFELKNDNTSEGPSADYNQSFGMSVRCIKGELDTISTKKLADAITEQEGKTRQINSKIEDEKEQQDEQTLETNVYYNQGVLDYTKCLSGGLTLSLSEERAVFDTRFPNGTDADFQYYKKGCQYGFMEWKANGN